jgi:4-hydroxybenzoate polyprenyltransferase
MIKLSHSVFALPFALAAALLASRQADVSPAQWVAVVAAVVTARASAMTMNRIADNRFDAANPRTATREIPSGQLGLRTALALAFGTAVAFVGICAWLGSATLALSPIALLVVWGYSWTKRFTAWCHVVLGVALALAPTGAWIALTGSYGPAPLLLSGAVATWVAGFDILYATQDRDFDRATGLHSVPVALGIAGALRLSSVLHGVTAALLAALPMAVPLDWPYGLGWLLIAGVLVWEHSLVRPDDLSRIDKAFFDLNGFVSLAFLGAVWLS